MVEGELEAAVAPGARLQRVDPGGDDLPADAIAGDGGNTKRSHLGSPTPVAFPDLRSPLRAGPRVSRGGIDSFMSTFRPYSAVQE